MYRTNVLNHFPSLIIDHTCTETKIFEHTLTGGAGNSRNLMGSGGRHPQIILKSRTSEIRFPAFWEVIFYRKAHYRLEVLEQVNQD